MKQLALFYGGYSSEFDISRQSALNISKSIPDGWKVHLLEVKKTGWHVVEGENRYKVDLNSLSFTEGDTTINFDAGLIYIHGTPGEDGKLQAYLEMKGLPIVNSNALSSELSFDKWYCNQFLRSFNFPVAPSIRLTKGQAISPEEVVQKLGMPVFVKPTDSGSSFGITKVKESSELEAAIEFAFAEGKTVVIEGFLRGRELTCATYRNEEGLVDLPLTEIISNAEWFDYKAKYEGNSREITPADVPDSLVKEIQIMTKEIYELLQLKSVARVDYILVENQPFILEVNTIPGFTNASLVPQMLEAAGISQKEAWSSIFKTEL